MCTHTYTLGMPDLLRDNRGGVRTGSTPPTINSPTVSRGSVGGGGGVDRWEGNGVRHGRGRREGVRESDGWGGKMEYSRVGRQ